MSIKYMNRVWDNQELKGGRLLVMLALADHANDAGECWPSQPHLALRARLDVRQVRRVIDSLATDGYVMILERGKGRSKRPHYRLFPQPQKSDILSIEKSDILSIEKSDISDTKSDILPQENRTFSAEKSDISEAVPSHVRSEPPIEPKEEPPIESSSSDEEDAAAILWRELCGDKIPENVHAKVNGLIGECGAAAVTHGIKASIEAHSRNFAYIAKCARNYVPAAAPLPKRYSVDIPQSRPATRASAPPTITPAPTGGPWGAVLSELRIAYRDADWVPWLEGSRLCERVPALDANGQPMPSYTIVVGDGVDTSRLINRALGLIRSKLGSILGKRGLFVEIVAAPAPIAAQVADLAPTP